MVSAIAWTSLSLCEMKMMDVPPSLQLADDAEQLLGLGRGEHRRGLVQDQHVGLPDQRLHDLDPLLEADRQVLDERVRVDVEAVAVRKVGDVAARLAPVEETGPGRPPRCRG